MIEVLLPFGFEGLVYLEFQVNLLNQSWTAVTTLNDVGRDVRVETPGESPLESVSRRRHI